MKTNTTRDVSKLRRMALETLLRHQPDLWLLPANVATAFGMSGPGAKYLLDCVRGKHAKEQTSQSE
jgi:hypothetical protein